MWGIRKLYNDEGAFDELPDLIRELDDFKATAPPESKFMDLMEQLDKKI